MFFAHSSCGLGMFVTVRTKWGFKEVNVLEGDTVEEIKIKLAPCVGIAAFEQVLTMRNGSVLQNHWVYGSRQFQLGTMIIV